MALRPRYAGDDLLQVVQVVAVAFMQSPFSGCTSPPGGFSRGGKRMVPYSIQWLKRLRPALFRQDLIALFDLLQQHKIKPLIAQRFPLAAARHSHELLGKGGVTGKIVLVRNGSSL
jgi:NADPH:quinone reductase-like Zn-dependent oxidoreductase